MVHGVLSILILLLTASIQLRAKEHSISENVIARCNKNVSCNFPLCKSGTPLNCYTMSVLSVVILTADIIKDVLMSPSNVLCINNKRRDSRSAPINYRLIGCPEGYTSTTQRTDGICVKEGTGSSKDLYLTTSKMTAGLHTLNCLTNSSSSTFEIRQIIAGKRLDCYIIRACINN